MRPTIRAARRSSWPRSTRAASILISRRSPRQRKPCRGKRVSEMSNGKGKSAKTSTHYDVAIVGGGVSGVYSGWRLLTAGAGESPQLKKLAGKNEKLKVAVFEGTNRIGGRLLS